MLLLILVSSCSKNADPIPSVTHPPGWVEKDSDNFHGLKVKAYGYTSEDTTRVLESVSELCTSCHGVDYLGGKSGVSCYEAGCHQTYPHADDWSTPGSSNSHAAHIKNIDWSLEECKFCHGNNYTGGWSSVSCYKCHLQTGGPEACNTCHGTGAADVSVAANWAPPKDLNNNIETTAIGVGAHQGHLKDSTLTTAYVKDCDLCHPNILTFDNPQHIDGDPSIDMQFNDSATDSGRIIPAWNMDKASCNNVYCHGNFSFKQSESKNNWGYVDTLITGNNVTVDWTNVGSGEAACGTCHGLPPVGHIPAASCEGCHFTVVDGNFNIINKNRHMNYKIDILNDSYRP
jgi:hypothetical protein